MFRRPTKLVLALALGSPLAWVAPAAAMPCDEVDVSAEEAARRRDLRAANSLENQAILAQLREIFLPMVKGAGEKVTSLTDAEIRALVDGARSGNYLSDIFNPLRIPDLPESLSDFGMNAGYRTLTYLSSNAEKNQSLVFKDKWDSFSGRFAGCRILVPLAENPTYTRLGNAASMVYASATPIGEYGDALTKSLTYTTAVMQKVALDYLEPNRVALLEANRARLAAEVARMGAGEYALSAALGEGILSASQAFSLLLAQKIDGFSYASAIEKLVARRGGSAESAFVEYVQRLPMGANGPLTIAGRYFPHPVEKSGDGLVLSPPFVAILKDLKKIQRDRLEKSLFDTGNRYKGENGVGCPLGFTRGSGDTTSGIQYLGHSFAWLFLRVDAILNGIPLDTIRFPPSPR